MDGGRFLVRGLQKVKAEIALPVTAYNLARALGIQKVLIPLQAGVTSALGLLEAPAAFDLTRTYKVPLDRPPNTAERPILPQRAVAQNKSTASSATRADHAKAQLLLGSLFADGSGVDRDLEKTVLWTRRAADQGLAQAQYSLGALYFRGSGVAADNVEAHRWLTLASEAGYAEADSALRLVDGRLAPEERARAALLVATWRSEHPSR